MAAHPITCLVDNTQQGLSDTQGVLSLEQSLAQLEWPWPVVKGRGCLGELD